MDLFYFVIDNLDKNKRAAYSIQHNIGRKIVEYAAKNVYKIKNSEIEVINSKPKFKYSNKHFSISHSQNIVIVGFDSNPLGIDVEYMRKRDFLSIAQRMSFSLKDNSLEEFYAIWTQYEAKYKLGHDTDFCISQKFLEEYMLSIASESKIHSFNIELIKDL